MAAIPGDPTGQHSADNDRGSALNCWLTSKRYVLSEKIPRHVMRECPLFGYSEVPEVLFSTANIVLIRAPPGSGKTYTVPLLLAKEAYRKANPLKIVLTERTRMLTKSIFDRYTELITDNTDFPFRVGRVHGSELKGFGLGDDGQRMPVETFVAGMELNDGDTLITATQVFGIKITKQIARTGNDQSKVFPWISHLIVDDFDGVSCRDLQLIFSALKAFKMGKKKFRIIILIDCDANLVLNCIRRLCQLVKVDYSGLAVDATGSIPDGPLFQREFFVYHKNRLERIFDEDMDKLRALGKRFVRYDRMDSRSTPNLRDLMSTTMEVIRLLFLKKGSMKVLVIVPSLKTISDMGRALWNGLKESGVHLTCFHSKFSSTDIQRRLSGERILILASDIAEEGITFVQLTHIIDMGMKRIVGRVDPIGRNVFYNCLCDHYVQQRRAARVGRTCDGKVIYPFPFPILERIMSREVELPAGHDVDEHLVLHHSSDLHQYVDPEMLPTVKSLRESIGVLGALDENNRRLPVGRFASTKFIKYPIRIAKLILAGVICDCLGAAIKLAALLMTDVKSRMDLSDILAETRRYSDGIAYRRSDHLALLVAYEQGKMKYEHEDGAKTIMDEREVDMIVEEICIALFDKAALDGVRADYSENTRAYAQYQLLVAIAMAFGDRIAWSEGAGNTWYTHDVQGFNVDSREKVFLKSESGMFARGKEMAVYMQCTPGQTSSECLMTVIPEKLYFSVGNIGSLVKTYEESMGLEVPTNAGGYLCRFKTREMRDWAVHVRDEVEMDLKKAADMEYIKHVDGTYLNQGKFGQKWLRFMVDYVYEECTKQNEMEKNVGMGELANNYREVAHNEKMNELYGSMASESMTSLRPAMRRRTMSVAESFMSGI